MGSLRGIKTPVIVLLGAGRMEFAVGVAVVGLLINNKPLGSGLHHWDIVLRFHRRDFKGNARDLSTQALQAMPEITA